MCLVCRDDDENGHYQFEIGENLSTRFKVMRKFGEGTFGQVGARFCLAADTTCRGCMCMHVLARRCGLVGVDVTGQHQPHSALL
jgi:hypothetical protein